MIDKDFTQAIREVKQSHERWVTAILGSDVFPGLDTKSPLESAEEDVIPARFGPNWFEYENRQQKVEEEKREAA